MAFNTPQTGLFTPHSDLGIINQDFFDAAFAGRKAADPIYKEAYNCNLIGECTMSTWLEEYMGWDTSCDTQYSLLETNSTTEQIALAAGATIPAYPATVALSLAAANHFVGGNYILPTVGNTLVAPNGQLLDVTAITYNTNASSVTVRQRNVNGGSFAVAAGNNMLVLSGAFLADCECPKGQFRFTDLPIVHDLEMIIVGDKGELCGDALLACQYLKIPFTDEQGNEFDKWYTEALARMYRDFEKRKHFERLFNPNFGVIPVVKTRGMNFATASPTEITLEDVMQWKRDLSAAGIMKKEYAVFAGVDAFIQWQSFLNAQGVTSLNYTDQPLNGCKWINMQYCGIEVAGLRLHIYEDCTFSNGRGLAGNGSSFPNASIFVPLGNRTTNVRGGFDNKMLTTTYFKDNTGRVWDNLTDSNGALGVRNTFGAGCDRQEWTIKSRFTQEVHCANAWGYSRLP